MSGFTLDVFPSKLGGGIPGVQPKLLGGGAGQYGGSGMEGGNNRAMNRNTLRLPFGNHTFAGKNSPITITNAIITPFRSAYNAGDTNGTTNETISSDFTATNQVNSIGPSRLHANGGGTRNNGGAAYSGNPKYVYDGSDYMRFKKLQAINRNYNDSSYGGADNSSFIALNRVRH